MIDLQPENFCVLRNDDVCVFTNIKEYKVLVDVKNGTYISLDACKKMHCYNIVKIYKDYTMKELLWKEDKPLLTEEEKQYLKTIIAALTCPVEYIHKGCLALSILLKGDDYIDLALYDNLKFKFNNLEEDKSYTLKELELEE